MTSHEATQKRVAFLYPGHASEHDYPHMADRLAPTVVAPVIHTDVPKDVHRPDALKRIGDVELLLEKQAEVQTFNPDAAMWACTSGSFVFGLDGASQQVRQLEEAEIRRALTRAQNNKSKAAELLGISRFALQRKLEKYEIGG